MNDEQQTANNAPQAASACPAFCFRNHADAAHYAADRWEPVNDRAHRKAIITYFSGFPLTWIATALESTDAALKEGRILRHDKPIAYCYGVLKNLKAETERAMLQRQRGPLSIDRPLNEKEQQQAISNERNAAATLAIRLQQAGRQPIEIEAALLQEGFPRLLVQQVMEAVIG